MKCEMWLKHQVRNSTWEASLNLEEILVIGILQKPRKQILSQRLAFVARTSVLPRALSPSREE